ncbi:MAG: methyltransferase [Acidimicrobiia bacterium]|nr:methyltransferase [Acidimicrobiia bacterium]
MGAKGTVGAVESRPPARTGQYFEAQPTVPSRPGRVHLALADVDLELGTDRGVFSAERIDAGTDFLLRDHARPDPAARILADIGCGYGPIALTLALRSPAAAVWAIDVNERALDLCRANAVRHGVADRVHAVTPEDVPADVRFDGLWSNPPIRAGKAHLHELLERWLARLAATGEARLVVQKHLGADSLAKWLTGEGWTVERLASRAGYRVLRVSR